LLTFSYRLLSSTIGFKQTIPRLFQREPVFPIID
jgi:hypothetical protein